MLWSFNLDGASYNRKKTQCLTVWVNLCFVSVAPLLWLEVSLPTSCGCRFCCQLLGICYAVWFAIYLVVVEFVICKLHPCVSVAKCVLCNTCFGWVGPSMAKIHALCGKSAHCILYPVCWWQIVNSRSVCNPWFVCTDKVDLVSGMCICSSSYSTVVVEIGLKGLHAHSLDHVIILWC